jgi:hypothetical protein
MQQELKAIRLPLDLVAEIDRQAEIEDRSRENMSRRLLRDALRTRSQAPGDAPEAS